MMSTPASISWPSKRRRSSPCCDLVKGANRGDVCRRFLMSRSRENRSSASRTEGTPAITCSRAVLLTWMTSASPTTATEAVGGCPVIKAISPNKVFSNKRATSLGPPGVFTKTRSSPLATRKSESPESPWRMTKSPSLSRRMVSERATAMKDSWVSSERNGSGYPASEALERHVYHLLVPPEVRDKTTQFWDAVVNGNDRDSHAILDNCKRDGQRITCEWFGAPDIDARGKIVGCLSMVHDVTERLRIEEKVAW